MKARFFFPIILVSFFLFSKGIFAATLDVTPQNPIQGEPVMIRIGNLGTTTLESVWVGNTELKVGPYMEAPAALYGFDIRQTPGTYRMTARFSDGTKLEKNIELGKRPKVEAPLGIPEKLGGNSTSSAQILVSTLAKENASLLGLRTGDHAFWKQKFVFPLENPVVTDTYGYLRDTVSTTITHKGTDFRAPEGTPVLAMNRGVARLVQTGRNYGKTIIVDHGLGLQTMYMHLSKIYVNQGELVLPGQVIGLSGQTGYAEKPHLHVSVRIREVSVDPMKFLELFNERH